MITSHRVEPKNKTQKTTATLFRLKKDRDIEVSSAKSGARPKNADPSKENVIAPKSLSNIEEPKFSENTSNKKIEIKAARTSSRGIDFEDRPIEEMMSDGLDKLSLNERFSGLNDTIEDEVMPEAKYKMRLLLREANFSYTRAFITNINKSTLILQNQSFQLHMKMKIHLKQSMALAF